MAIKKIVEMQKKKIDFLVGVDPTFVSLVRHGANQQPFRIIKAEKGGEEKMSMVVQSILLPKNVSLEGLQAKDGLEWLADAKTDEVTQHGEYKKLIQMKEDKFDKNSLSLVKLDKSGAFALAGHLVDKADLGSALSLGRQATEKVPSIQPAPIDTVVAEEPRPAFVLTFRDMFEKELSSFLDVVRGSLSQSSAGQKQRKKTVMDALDAFKNFLSIGIDALGQSKAKIEKSDINAKGQAEGGVNMLQFKTEQEFTDKVAAIVADSVEKALKAQKPAEKPAEKPAKKEEKPAEKPDEKPAKKEEKTDEDSKMDTILSKIDGLGTAVKELKEKQAKLESQPATDAAAAVPDDEGLVSKKEDKTKKSVFAGLLVRPEPQAAQV